MVILDTCAIIEAIKPAPSFAKKTVSLIDAGAYILSVSFAEIACKIRLGKLEINVSTRDLFRDFSGIYNIEIVNIGVSEWLDSIDLNWDENKDPADRLIVSYAAKHELAIVTNDKKIQKFYKKVIW